MAVTNDFQPFAYGGAANVLTQAQYLALTSLLQNGFSSGVANSQQLNKVWRQSSIMSAVLAQFIVDETGLNATDDGTTATLLANLKTAVDQVARIRLASPPAIGNTVAAPSIASVNVSTGQLATPGAATGTGSTTGGTLAAATYYVKIVAVDALGGVTAAGAESVGVTTTGTTSSIAYTWTAVTNAASYQIWYGTAAGAESAYYTSATNNFTLTATSGTAGTLPTANTTGGMSSAGTVTVAPATQSQHALQLGQAKGRLLNVQKFTTHGTFPYTPTAGTTAAYAECQGAGASGGGTPATGAGQVAVGGGGAAGSFGSSWFPTGIASGTTITVGQGGAAVANANNPGGTSSIGALLSAPGGGGGSIAGPTTPPWVTGGGNTGGSASGANLIAARGQSGEASIAINSSNAGYGGAGGPSVYGGGGSQAAAGANGSAGVSPGSGGGGCFAGASTVQLIGGAGADGCVLIYEYGTA